MLEVNLRSYKGELQLSLPDLFHLAPPTELSDEEHTERGQQVESAVRQFIAEFCASRPFLSPKGGINILLYRNNIKSPTAIKFTFDERTKHATGWTGLSAKVFLADRSEYEPDLFDILPVKMS
jgi:hypothetical protein